MKYACLNDAAALAMQYDALALTALSHLIPRYIPWTNSTLRPAAIQVILNDILLNRRRLVVELGTGASTLFISAMLAETQGQLITIDHSAPWIDIVRPWLTAAQSRVTTFVHAPLHRRQFDGEDVQWYDPVAIGPALGGAKADLVVVDGPPAYFKDRCLERGPALEIIEANLAPGATIILDDINRAGERRIADRWSERLGCPYRDLTIEAGIAVWHTGEALNISQ